MSRWGGGGAGVGSSCGVWCALVRAYVCVRACCVPLRAACLCVRPALASLGACLHNHSALPLAPLLMPCTPPHSPRPKQAYVLNPAIYSAHLKLHPLLVLCALVVAEHGLGVWGLLLAVPLTVFALDYLIR